MGGTRHWRGAAEYALWTERRKKGRKERGDGQDVLQARHPDESRRGGKRKEPKSARTGNIESLKIGTESRGNYSLCSGLELHHPIMSKLWNLGGRTKRKIHHAKVYSPVAGWTSIRILLILVAL